MSLFRVRDGKAAIWAVVVFVFLMLSPLSTYSAVECDKLRDTYNMLVTSYDFRGAMDLLKECSESCGENERTFCSGQARNLKVNIRAIVDAFSKKAGQSKDVNPAVALRAYEKVLFYGSLYPERTKDAVGEAENEIPRLRNNIDEKINPLLEQAEAALQQNQFDTVKNLLYEIYSIDFGNSKAKELSKRASRRIDDYLESENNGINTILDELGYATEKLAKIGSQQEREIIRKKITKDYVIASGKIESSLKLKPGNEKIIQSGNKLKRISENMPQTLAKISVPALDASLTEPLTKKYDTALSYLKNGQFTEAIELLRNICSSSTLDDGLRTSAHLFSGICYALMISASTYDKNLRLNAKKEFRNALMIDKQVELPSDYKKNAIIAMIFADVKNTS
ncbi:MAG: hypothetical protein HQK92_14760 [Nitrospirae bacterium]|nr:hypothetical protein [Nitrospirota bacterium]